MIPRIIAIFILLFTISGCSEPPYTNIDNNQLKSLVAEGVPLYDIRRPEEWKQTGIVKSSRLLTFIDGTGNPVATFLPNFTREIGKNDPVILICRTGNRSSVLSNHLMVKMGYTKVYNVDDGIVRWISEKNPVIRQN
jgi:rhodanese-related sulfurtransferase